MNNATIGLKQIPVKGSFMAYREAGSADAPPVLFLHGNPTSSYIWRNIIPLVAPIGHCIAPDLIGFGQSGKPAIDYRFVDHVAYLDAFIDALGLQSTYLVVQDWGSALGLHLAARKPSFVRGLALMEFIRPAPTWDDFHQTEMARDTFKKFRTPGVGEKLVMEENLFIERVLPASVVRKLTEEEMAAYRAPFPTPQSRLPIWRFPNQLPIEGSPVDVVETLDAAHAALQTSTYPKVMFAADPGALISLDFAKQYAAKLKNCQLELLGKGYHYLQEDHAQSIGKSVYTWLNVCESRKQKTAVA